jgi:phage tail P2-like protein
MLSPSLLPPNATPVERALEATLARTDDLPIEIGKLWNPDTCPAPLLPFLAWALSVDVWDAAWPEAIQRRVIANSPAVHRAKGTRAAVVAALDGLMVQAGITEWWQPGGSGVAGTFIIRAYASARWTDGAPLITPDLIVAIRAMVTASAPVSRPWTLQVGVAAAADIGAAAAFAPGLKIVRPDYDIAPPRCLGGGIGVSAALHRGLKIIRHEMELAA